MGAGAYAVGGPLAAVLMLCVACAGGTEAATGRPEPAAAASTTSTSVTPTVLTSTPTSPPAPVEAPLPSTDAITTTAPAAVSAPPVTVVPTPPTATDAAGTTTIATIAPATTTASTTTTVAGPPPGAGAAGEPRPPLTLQTSCRQVAHIGDSTSEHLWDPGTVGGDPASTMEARYHAAGVEDVYNDTSGGRSMVERINRQRNAIEAAEDVRASGFRGCWVLMIGTNDAANVAAGANAGLEERLESMLAVIDGDPVLWVNTSSNSTIRWYGDDSMQAFNAALAHAAARHPNLWVLDWAAVVQPEWYGPDGLHYGPTGRAWRTALTAQELAWAFPA